MLGLSPLLPTVFFPETFDRHAKLNIVHDSGVVVCCGSDKNRFQNAVVSEIRCWWWWRLGRFYNGEEFDDKTLD